MSTNTNANTQNTRYLDVLAAGGVCLLGLALLDVALGALKRVTEISQLWKSCGIIGAVLLGAYLVLGVFDGNSHLRQGARGCWNWLASSLRRRKKDQAEPATDEVEDAFFVEEWRSPAAGTSEAGTNGPVPAAMSEEAASEEVDDEERNEPELVGGGSAAKAFPK